MLIDVNEEEEEDDVMMFSFFVVRFPFAVLHGGGEGADVGRLRIPMFRLGSPPTSETSLKCRGCFSVTSMEESVHHCQVPSPKSQVPSPMDHLHHSSLFTSSSTTADHANPTSSVCHQPLSFTSAVTSQNSSCIHLPGLFTLHTGLKQAFDR